ncbi:MAG: 4-(cytidine 5'-diphospho)-2-C-methyl-D-erythritol kinase [Oscillospiraceae bacterium]|nr:4-(cytidine 5'-diphospho)-2-C-methyl-D-erythritol kinase [Oscillospiraceae bacterium]
MNQKMTIRCNAKINLSLDVTGKREDGYHTLESIFQSVTVYDILTVGVSSGSGITLRCSIPALPCDERNLAYRAAQAMLEASGKKCSVQMTLHKHIPSGAGMGGGSADAAGVLFALNKLLRCGYSNEKLREIGIKLGADVPFLLMGGTVLAEGIGEILTPLRPLPELPLVILKGRQSISTPKAYAAIDALEAPFHPDTKQMRKAVAEQDAALLAKSCGNTFEDAVGIPDVQRAKEALLADGALCAVMTGSGSAVFGIFDDKQKAEECALKRRGEFAFAQACRTIRNPFYVIAKRRKHPRNKKNHKTV